MGGATDVPKTPLVMHIIMQVGGRYILIGSVEIASVTDRCTQASHIKTACTTIEEGNIRRRCVTQ